MRLIRSTVGSIVCMSLAMPAGAQSGEPVPLEPIVVTATRHEERAFDVPASIDIISGAVIRDGQPAVNISETLPRVPGVFAANRQNYAQDLQISSRGFGARAAFGVRGVRLYQDGIPVTMPDGQGQTGSFSLLSAESVEVLRDTSHVRDYSASEWLRQVSEAGLHTRSTTRQRLRLEYTSWVERMRTPQALRVAIRELQQAMGAEVREYFEIEADGSFSTDVLVLWAER